MRAQQSRCENVRVRCFYLCRLSWIASRREPAARVTCLDSRVHQTSKQPSRRRIAKRDLSNLSEGGRRSAGHSNARERKWVSARREISQVPASTFTFHRSSHRSLFLCASSQTDRQFLIGTQTHTHPDSISSRLCLCVSHVTTTYWDYIAQHTGVLIAQYRNVWQCVTWQLCEKKS